MNIIDHSCLALRLEISSRAHARYHIADIAGCVRRIVLTHTRTTYTQAYDYLRI